jgi:hypothetical protein
METNSKAIPNSEGILSSKQRLNRFWKSRRGEEALVDFWAIIIFVFILLVFTVFFMLSRHKSTQDTMNDFQNKDVAFMLDSFLRARYLPMQTKTMGEIIGEDALNDDFERTENSFHYFFEGIDTYTFYQRGKISLCIEQDGSKLDSVDKLGEYDNIVSAALSSSCGDFSDGKSTSDLPGDLVGRTISSSTIIPGIDNKPITVTLIIRYIEDPKRSPLNN